MANDRYGDIKIIIDGDNAKWMYDVIVNSRVYKEFPNSLKLNYRENLLLIEESWWGYSELYDFILPFLLGDDYFYIQHTGTDDSWETNYKNGKHFKRGAFYHSIRVPEFGQEVQDNRITYEEYLSKYRTQEAEVMKDFYTLSPEEQIDFCIAHKDKIIFSVYEIINGELRLTHYDD